MGFASRYPSYIPADWREHHPPAPCASRHPCRRPVWRPRAPDSSCPETESRDRHRRTAQRRRRRPRRQSGGTHHPCRACRDRPLDHFEPGALEHLGDIGRVIARIGQLHRVAVRRVTDHQRHAAVGKGRDRSSRATDQYKSHARKHGPEISPHDSAPACFIPWPNATHMRASLILEPIVREACGNVRVMSKAVVRRQFVGWVERSETHHCELHCRDGFRCALPILVSARPAKVRSFRKEWPGLGGRPDRAADRRIVTHRSIVS
jgi:hypothetical protein